MKQLAISLMLTLLFAAQPTAADPQMEIDVIPSGGGNSVGIGFRITDTLGQPCVGTVAMSGAGYRLRDGFWTPRNLETPVFLLAFNHLAEPGRVDLSWACQADQSGVDFRLTATLGDRSWEPEWSATRPGLFACRDEAEPLLDGGLCIYRLEARLDGENWQLQRVIEVAVPAVILVTGLDRPFPNPFNPTVTLPLELAQAGRVRIRIFDVSGREQARIMDGDLDRGRHTLTWQARDATGQDLTSGVYFLRLETVGYSVTRKLVLLR